MTLLDSPGIVFSSGGGDAAAALRNCLKVRPFITGSLSEVK